MDKRHLFGFENSLYISQCPLLILVTAIISIDVADATNPVTVLRVASINKCAFITRSPKCEFIKDSHL